MSLKVIGAGFGRTGTMSMKLALEQLGFGRCYHMKELMSAPENYKHWDNISKGQPADLENLFGGFQSTVDYPGCLFYRELGEFYPEAKVVLNVRDPEQWWQSCYDTIFNAEPSFLEKLKIGLQLPFSSRVRNLLRTVDFNVRTIYKGIFQGRQNDKEFAIQVYHQHIDDVKAHFPAERLLIFNVKEGWEPLCKFLEVPIPETDFPRSHARKEFPALLQRIYKGEDLFKDQ